MFLYSRTSVQVDNVACIEVGEDAANQSHRVKRVHLRVDFDCFRPRVARFQVLLRFSL